MDGESIFEKYLIVENEFFSSGLAFSNFVGKFIKEMAGNDQLTTKLQDLVKSTVTTALHGGNVAPADVATEVVLNVGTTIFEEGN